MLTTMLVHFFLWHLKLRLGKKTPALTVAQLRTILDVVLHLRTSTIEEVLALVAWVQKRNHRAYLSIASDERPRAKSSVVVRLD